MTKEFFRHPYEELRKITDLPLAEARWLGDGEPLRRLVAAMDASDVVRSVAEGPATAGTRMVVTDADPARFADWLGPGPLPRTCVVVSLAGRVGDGLLPEPGMCLEATLEADGKAGLSAVLLPRATTTPEALELVAELLHTLGVTLAQRPVDEPPR